ncbi:MAG: 50S ribosomal protein L24, partial [uncultured bacterium]
DKGKKGKIEKIFPKNQTVLLPGLNVYKKHLKKRDEQHPGGIVDFPRPVSIANVALLCSKCRQPTRVGFKVTSKKKTRVCKKCSSVL